MADSESFHARRPTTVQDDTTISMTEISSDENHQEQQQHQQTIQASLPREHYNISIPVVSQWPLLLADGLQVTAKYTTRTLRRFYNRVRSDGDYQGVPTSANDSSSFHVGRGFKEKRHSRNNGGCCSRRYYRILVLFFIGIIVFSWIITPKTLKPYHNRDVWVRFFNHEEAIKVTLPYRRVVHVHDVKTAAMKELDIGFGVSHQAGNIKLFSEDDWLRPDEEWNNDNLRFSSNSRYPIVAVNPRFELLLFLNDTLGCFSGFHEHPDIDQIKFFPAYQEYRQLARILVKINEMGGKASFHNSEIMYLRSGFSDPKKDEILDYNGAWIPPKEQKFIKRPHFIVPIHDFPVDRNVSWSSIS